MSSERLRIALTKGRLQDKSVELFEAMGLDCATIKDPGRRLIHSIANYPMDAVLAKAPDVITYVEHGVCDLGVVGKDTILEKGGAFYEVLDLNFGKCRFALAVKENSDFYGTYKTRRIASKYPNVTKNYFIPTIAASIESKHTCRLGRKINSHAPLYFLNFFGLHIV